MSYPYELEIPSNQARCPYCGAEDQEGEDLGDHPSYLSFECGECGRSFARDTWRDITYNDKGEVVK